MGILVAKELATTLNTHIEIGRINIGLLNRIIIDDVLLNDQSGKELLKAARLSAKFDILPLFEGKISISNVQLFGFQVNLNRKTPDASPNFKFIIDAFASKDTIKKETSLDLRVNSLLIRRGKLAYDVLSEAETPGKFNTKHVRLQNIIGSLSLKALNKDSLNIGIKRLSLDEKASGFSLKKLAFRLTANQKRMNIENFNVELPQTSLNLDTIRATYDSLKAFENFTEQVHFSLRTLPSSITLKDLSPFIPTFVNFNEPITLDMAVSGTIDQLNCSHLSLTADNRQVQLLGNLTIQGLSRPQSARMFCTFSTIKANAHGVSFLQRNLTPKESKTSPMLERLGDVSFRGNVSGHFPNFIVNGQLDTSLGGIKTDLTLSSDRVNHSLTYSGAVETKSFELGRLLNNGKVGNIVFNMEVNGEKAVNGSPAIDMKGVISSIEYNKYKYGNILLDGKYESKGFNGSVTLNDPNGSVYANGSVDMSSEVPTFNFIASVDGVRPNALNLTRLKSDMEVSLKVKANFAGNSIDEIIGEINVDSLRFVKADKDYFLKNINIHTVRQDKKNHFKLSSEFLTADLEGNFQYRTLPNSVLNIARKYVPSLLPNSKTIEEAHNDFLFDINIYNVDILSSVFEIPLTIYTHSTLKGCINDTLQRLRIEGYFPRLQYKNNYIESGMVLCESSSESIRTKARFTNLKKKGIINLSLDTQAKNDEISATLYWGNGAKETYSGRFSSVVNFMRHENEKTLKTVVDIQPTDIILNDTIWQIHPSQVIIDSGKIDIGNFYFSHKDRYIRINGRVSENPDDTVKIDLKDINIGYVFDIANVSDDVDFEGDASGTAYASGILKTPIMKTHLLVRNFSLNQGLLGELDIYGAWDNDNRGILLNASIKDEAPLPTKVNGTIYPLKPESGLDLNIKANELNIKFLEHYMRSIAKDVRGKVTGNVRLYGKFKGLNLEGVALTDASMQFDVLNTRFGIKDSIHLSPSGLTFNNAQITDAEGHSGTMSGYLRYQHFKNINYRFEVWANNMLLMNTKEPTEMPFYGTVYATGNAVLSGDVIRGFNADVAMTTNRNTLFTYVNGNVMSAASNQFIKFVDKTPRRAIQDSVLVLSYYEQMQQETQELENRQKTDIHLNILLDATPDATMKIIMDPIAGDYISGKGTGNIRAEFYNKGDLKMFGNYQISQGLYKFSLQEVIRKDFIIREGGTINFNGAPLEANMDIQAYYTVNSASLNDLIPDASSIIQQPNVRVNCIMNLSGALTHPTINLGIELPNERDEIQALVRNYISTDEQMNMQILYLLSIGKFYTENTRNGNQNSNVMSSVLSSTLSGQLNNALSQVFETNNWNIGTNLSTGDKGWTDMEVEGILSGQLLNNRLLVNGNFGYRDNPMANTNFVGDFEAEWLLTRSGDVRLKAYNETNDRYYTKTNLTTQGIGIMYKKDFDKWNELFFWNNWKIKNVRRQKKADKK